MFGLRWVHSLSSSFPHSILASAGDKHQWQPTNQQDPKEISRTLQDYIIMPAQPFSWIHVKSSSWSTFYFSSSLNSHQSVCKQLSLHQTGWLVPSSQATGVFFASHTAFAWITACAKEQSSLCSSQGACSCSSPHENQRLASNSTRGRIRPPCRTSDYQLVTLTDSICRESLWKMQSIMQPLLIFCFCCIYSWFMSLQGG